MDRDSVWEAIISIPDGPQAGLHASLRAPSRIDALDRACVYLGGATGLDDRCEIHLVVRNTSEA